MDHRKGTETARETLEELRERLLRQHHVQQMIEVRAYEIYQMRGGRPGGEAQDWFHAEHEVLAFLLAGEMSRDDDHPQAVPAVSASSPDLQSDPAVAGKLKSGTRKKSGEPKATTSKKQAAKPATPKKSAQAKSKPPRVRSKSKTEE
jgi:hypothetical protein